ncbi:MAG: tetratricopeptide repeat protein [Candidatus Obscuribacterales bacterium]|nr:tetratricopeptide repeat protein [Candidatus Obscuribacterales bacterium]
MAIILWFLLALGLAGGLWYFWAKPAAERRADYNAAAEADGVLQEAEMACLRHRFDLARALYERALKLALPVDALLASEACYGLARVAMENKQWPEAVAYLESALALQPDWPVAKDEYARFLEDKLRLARRAVDQTS